MPFFLIFKPFQKDRKDGKSGRYDFRHQTFMGFTDKLPEALRMLYDDKESNYQVYEIDKPELNFQKNKCVRYGFRKRGEYMMLYRRTPRTEDSPPVIEDCLNPLLPLEEATKQLEEVRNHKREVLVRKKERLNKELNALNIV